MDLNLLLLIPLISAIAILFCSGLKQVRLVALTGAVIQLMMSLSLFYSYITERSSGNNAQMLFQNSYLWFESLNINYQIGVDGISVAMIMLTAFVVLAGILVSWKMEFMHKEFFFLLLFLSLGAYGFFISLDLFSMFFSLKLR